MSGPNEVKPGAEEFLQSQANLSRNHADPKSNLHLNPPTKEEEDDAEAMAKDTGLMWIYDGASPLDDRQEKFSFKDEVASSQDQFSTLQTDNMKDLEYSMSNMSVNNEVKTQNFSSTSLQGYNNMPSLPMHPPRYHGASSQVVNSIPPLEEVNYESR